MASTGSEDPHPATVTAVREVLEALLTPESLKEDGFLRSQMTTQLYVPIAVLLCTPGIAELQPAAGPEHVVAAARESSEVVLDPSGTMLKPNIQVKRNTLALRDLSASTTIATVEALFAQEGCPAPLEVRSSTPTV